MNKAPRNFVEVKVYFTEKEYEALWKECVTLPSGTVAGRIRDLCRLREEPIGSKGPSKIITQGEAVNRIRERQ